jgi:LysM repeat protein
VLLVAIALTVSLALGAPGPTPSPAPAVSPRSQLPATQPGLSRNEGVFLVTAADDGSPLVYFIAQNTRHSILPADLQLEQVLNSLWPVDGATREEVMAFSEAAPVGSARTGLLTAPVVAEPMPIDDAPGVAEAPAVGEALSVVEAPVVEQQTASDSAVYVLRPGDNLTRLSARYSTTVPDILAANGLTNPNRVYIGQALLIPGVASAPEEILATPSPATVAGMVESPDEPTPVAADESDAVADVPASTDEVTYTVKPGDSVIRIARQFGLDVNALVAANGVVNRNRVYIGQLLSIPAV